MKKQLIGTILAIFIGLSLTQTAFADSVYIVQPGDTLSNIALGFDGISWLDIARANDIVNPNVIYVGQVLRIPDGAVSNPNPTPTITPATGSGSGSGSGSNNNPNPATYTVQAGDNLYRISLRFNTTVDSLITLNGISDRGVIYIGQVLQLPDGVVESQPTPTQVASAATATPAPAATATPVPAAATNTPAPAATATPAPQPTATPVPPAPQPATGTNLLKNGSFEEGHYNQNGIPELQLPNNWGFEWDEGNTGFGNEKWDVWIRPETRVLSKAFIPSNEHGLYFFGGEHTVKIFKGFGAISVRMYQDIELQPGTYQLTIRGYSDMVQSYDGGKQFASDPSAAEGLAFAGGTNSGWQAMPIGQRGSVSVNFTVDSPQVVRVGASLRGRFALENNGFFVDDWTLVKLN